MEIKTYCGSFSYSDNIQNGDAITTSAAEDKAVEAAAKEFCLSSQILLIISPLNPVDKTNPYKNIKTILLMN